MLAADADFQVLLVLGRAAVAAFLDADLDQLADAAFTSIDWN